MSPLFPIVPVSKELKVSASKVLDIDLPALTEAGAICIGVSIDWRYHDALLAYAVRHTFADEHARAERFLRPEDKLRHLLGRAMLRRVATHYGGMEPVQMIRYNPWGKPELPGCTVGCNISHSDTQVWVAVSRFPQIGIDIESATAPQEFKDIAAGFHPDEIAALRRMPDPGTATMRCWSRKEAVSKATGMGLSLPLHAYAVDCDIKPSGWLKIAPPKTARAKWTTVDVQVGKGYVGALAVEGVCDRINVLRLTVVS